MPVSPTYPGVYIEEVPSGVRTITGVSTSVGAFIGTAKYGSINKAKRVYNYAEFERKYNISKSKFDKNNFLNPKDKSAKTVLRKYASMPVDIPRPEKAKERLTTVIADTIYDNIQLPALFMGYQFPEQTHKDYYALQMMNDVLSGGSSSRINKNLVEKQEIAQFALSFGYGLEDAGAGIFRRVIRQLPRVWLVPFALAQLL